jgi:hypothetical protein
LAIKRGDAREGDLRLIESAGGEGFCHLQSDEGSVDLCVCDNAYVRSAFRLSYLVLDDLPVLAEG